jgi:hypothetical protein
LLPLECLESRIEGAGFNTRYEILEGNTKDAYRALMRHKKPAENLAHLQLELREIETLSQLRPAMALQKTVALVSKKHGYFSHTPAQLRPNSGPITKNTPSICARALESFSVFIVEIKFWVL